MAVTNPVTGAVFQLDAYNIDGAKNVNRSDGMPLPSLKDSGSPADDLVPVDSPTLPDMTYERARFKQSDVESSICFRGVADRYQIPNSDSRFAFLHTTGVFDFFIALRSRGHGVSEQLFGNMTNTDTDKGLAIGITASGQPVIALGNGTQPIIFSNGSFEAKVPRNVPSMLQIRGSGTGLTVSANLFDFEAAQPYTAALGSGNAARIYTFGATTGLAVGGTSARPLSADVFYVGLYSTLLTPTQLVAQRAALLSRMPTT